MNHRSTLTPEYRARSEHRYRDDDEPLGPHVGPLVDYQRNSLYNAAPQPDYGQTSRFEYGPAALPEYDPAQQTDYRFHNAADQQIDSAGNAADSWPRQDSWTQQDSWSDGGAWSSGEAWEEDSWTPEDDGSWAQEQTWAPEPVEPESSVPATPTVIPGRRANKRGGAHRVPAPPSALKGRAAVAAVAAGAVVAAGQAAFASPEQPAQAVDYEAAGQVHEIAAQWIGMAEPDLAPESPQVLSVSAPANLGEFNDILQKGQKFADDLAAQESAKLRPLFTKFAAGTFTSGFGARWGVQHLGVDIAGPIGTPIVAVADGTVLEAGPAAGFGMWVRLQHDDGTVTIYGHIDTATVSQGQRVIAGDQIATIGNRGFSTGPHCHFEVWLNGHDKVDPLPWLASRGISLGSQRD